MKRSGWRMTFSRHARMVPLWAAVVGAALTVTPAGADPSAAAGAQVGLFGFLEFASDRLTALPLWREALQRIAEERERIVRCDRDVGQCESTAMTVWRAKVAELAVLPPLERLIEINRFVNRLPARDDRDAYDKADYWAAPLEFLERGGDAEDFAIMKFVSLRDAGIDNAQMRIAVVYDALQQQRHAVLAVALERGTYILDTVSDAVQPAERVRYYVPYYSVNETTRWAYVVRAPRPSGG